MSTDTPRPGPQYDPATTPQAPYGGHVPPPIDGIRTLGPPPPAPPQPRRRRPWAWLLAGLFAVLWLGSCGALLSAPDTAAAPAVVVTETAPGPTVTAPAGPGSTETVTATVSEVPDSCLEALDHADDGFTLSGQALQSASKIIRAIVAGDVPAVESENAELEKLRRKMDSLSGRYVAAKTECRAAADR